MIEIFLQTQVVSATIYYKRNWFMLLVVGISSYGCTWEVWIALKKLVLLSVVPWATLMLLLHASIAQYTHAKHEPILKCCRETVWLFTNHVKQHEVSFHRCVKLFLWPNFFFIREEHFTAVDCQKATFWKREHGALLVHDNTFNLLTPKLWKLIVPSSCYTFPCRLVTRIWC